MNGADLDLIIGEIHENRKQTQEIRKELREDRKDWNSALTKKISRAELATILTVVGLVVGISFGV